MEDLELAEDLFADCGFCVDEDDLWREGGWVRIGVIATWEMGMREGRERTFFAMIVLLGTCSTIFTLPPFPAPSSFRSRRSSFRSSKLISSFISSDASLLLSVVTYVLRFAFGTKESLFPGSIESLFDAFEPRR